MAYSPDPPRGGIKAASPPPAAPAPAMLFATLDYLLFLPLTVLAYWLVAPLFGREGRALHAARLAIMGGASWLFYASWRLDYVPVLVGVIAVAWGGGLWVARPGNGKGAPRAVVLGLLALPLLTFKYYDWIAGDVELAASRLGFAFRLPHVDLALPVGISFFTFQALAYVVDVSRGQPAERSPWRFATFINFFPQLVAGPIVRRAELLPQLLDLPLLQRDQVGRGLYRIGVGLAKKVLVADVLRVGMVDPLFADPGRFTGPELMIGLYAYTLQIYYDFSAYTDIAIGSGRLFGIELPENFQRPYKATSVAAFWRRWHITLSNWVRDYVYFPLGGARAGAPWKVYRNLMLTLLIIGLWHGASWNFVIYGLLHGLAMSVNRFQRKRTGRKPNDPLPTAWAWFWRFFLTLHFVVLARILFRAPDLPGAWDVATGLLRVEWVMPRFSHLAWAVFAVGWALHFTPERWDATAQDRFVRTGPLVWALAAAALAVAVFHFGTGESLSFIYYDF